MSSYQNILTKAAAATMDLFNSIQGGRYKEHLAKSGVREAAEFRELITVLLAIITI